MLANGEKIDSIKSIHEFNEAYTDDELNEKYRKGETRIVTEQARYPLKGIKELFGSVDYQIDPEFQRRRVWNNDKKSRLIESFIINIPLPPIFLYEDEYSHYQLMDGLQRITTVIDFYSDGFKLSNLSEWPELNGKSYSELPSEVKKGIDRRYISSIILLKETAANKEEEIRLKQMVFERINSGGVKLEPQEIRNAVMRGPLNDLCNKMRINEDLKYLWLGSIDDEDEKERIFSRMEDAELILRFIAFRQRDRLYKGGKLSDYLDDFLRYGNLWKSETLDEIEKVFCETIKLARDIFDMKAFWVMQKKRGGNITWTSRPTTVIYDPLMWIISQYLDKRDVLIDKKNEICSDLETIYQTNSDNFQGRYTNPSDWGRRTKIFKELFDKHAI